MRVFIIFIALLFSQQLIAQQSIDEMESMIRDSQMNDETNDWIYYGTFPYKISGIDNSVTSHLQIDANTTVRMYLLAQTDCYIYFDVRDSKDAYVFGTKDPTSLESELGNGFKAATSIFTYNQKSLMNINFGVRWGCKNMIDTEMKLLVFYVNKNAR